MVHRSPAQWASPLVVATGLTVAVEKLSSILANSAHGILTQLPEPGLGGALDIRRPSWCSPDVLICSGASGLNVQGVVDRLLVASHMWGKGISAEYLPQDVWGHRAAGVELSVEQMTVICLSLNIPYLVIVKAHTLKEKQSVKVRSVLDPSEPDQLVPLSGLVKYLQGRSGTGYSGDAVMSPSDHSSRGAAPFTTTPHHFYQHHHQHYAPGTSLDVSMTYLLSHSGGAGPGDKKRAFKEQSATERKVKSHLEAMFGASGTTREPLRVVVVDLPYAVMREISTAFILHGRDSPEVEEVLREYGSYKKVLKLLLDSIHAMEAEDLIGRGQSGGKRGNAAASTGGSFTAAWAAKVIFLYSVTDDCIDIIPLHMATNNNTIRRQNQRSVTGGGGRAGVPKR